MKRNLNWQKNAGMFALGATAGSAAALLLAPASGRAARKKLALKFRSMERSANRQLQQSKRLLTKKAELWKDAAAERIGDTREWLMERLPSNGSGRHHPLPRRAAHR